MEETFIRLAQDFAIALFLGALVGLEREKKKQLEHGAAGGLRTFILLAEAGAVAAYLSKQLANPWLFAGFGLLVGAAILTGYVLEARRRGPEAMGLTTEIAGMVVYLLGGTVLFGYRELAVALGIATSAVLAFKEPLHGVVERLGRDDIYAGLKLLIATFIVLPLLPNHAVDPWGALNPSQLWRLVILISVLSLVGYLAVRWLGHARGTALTGLFGGMVSSTAVTLTFSRRSRSEPAMVSALATGILLAWSVMFARVIIMVAVVERSLLPLLAAPMAAMLTATLAVATIAYRRDHVKAEQGGAEEPVRLTNPFSLTAATKFGLFFALIQLAVKLAATYLPPSSLYVVAALAGATDVDAITLSMCGSLGQGTAPAVAAGAIVVAALSNTVVKAGLAATLAAPALRKPVVIATVAAVALAVVVLLLG